MLYDHLNPCYKNEDWHRSYPLIWKCVHSISYVIHTATSSTCCFWQLGNRCEKCHVSSSFFFLFFFFFFLSFVLRFFTSLVEAHTVPLSPTKPVIIVHPVNLVLFYFHCFVFCWICQRTSLLTLEAVAKCVSFKRQGHTDALCTCLLCICIYCT